jgi:two-component system sensor histidine kinase KdpD
MRLVELLLDISRIDAGRLLVRPEPVDVGALVERAASSMRQQAGGRLIAVHAPTGILLHADPQRLELVLVNLLENALKYSPSGEPVDVTVEMEAAGAGVRIAVRDRGIGIPPGRRERLFERFHWAHEEDRVAGLGLGLHVAHQIIEAHGGRLEATFPPEGGSCFVVSLPLGEKGGNIPDEEGKLVA